MNDGPILTRVSRMVTDPGAELGRLGRFVRFQAQLWHFCAGRLRENNLLAMSAALSFRTIFALIPAIVLAFLAARSLGTLENSKASLRHVLKESALTEIRIRPEDAAKTEASGAGAGASTVADLIEGVVDQVEGKLTFQTLGPVGGVLFVWTAITLLTTIERSLNRIFGAPRSRSLPRRVLLYWSVLTLGPVVLAVASYVGRRTVATFNDLPGLAWMLVVAGWVGPIVVGVIVLASVYFLLPNTSVDWRGALGGAVAAVILWSLAKWGFAQYVQKLVVQQRNLYGVLGVFPLFMLWLNLSWTIFLFGAELAHTAAHLDSVRASQFDDVSVLGPADALAVALAVARPFEAGSGPVTSREIAREARLPLQMTGWVIERLETRGILCTANGRKKSGYVLARPAGRVSVADVLAAGEPGAASAGEVNGEIGRMLVDVEDRVRASLEGVTLGDLMAKPGPKPAV